MHTYYLPALLLTFSLLSCTSPETKSVGTVVNARTEFYPPVLYPGPNWISITDTTGIDEVRITFEDTLLYEATRVEGAGGVEGCPTSHDIGIHLPAGIASRMITLGIAVTRCDGTIEKAVIRLNTTWNVDIVSFPDVGPSEESCRHFQIKIDGYDSRPESEGSAMTVTSITSPDSRISFEHTTQPPLRILRGSSYGYRVCFSSDTVGTFRLPVITWIRRDFPNRGLTTYPVADTAVIVVRRVSEQK